MHDLTIDLHGALRKAFDQRLPNQSPATLSRLRQARQSALEAGVPKGLWAWFRLTPWVPASLALATSVLLAILVFPLSQGSPVGIDQWYEDMAMLEADPGLDMEDELDFYLWLDMDS